jgi:hypothetical protein
MTFSETGGPLRLPGQEKMTISSALYEKRGPRSRDLRRVRPRRYSTSPDWA